MALAVGGESDVLLYTESLLRPPQVEEEAPAHCMLQPVALRAVLGGREYAQ